MTKIAIQNQQRPATRAKNVKSSEAFVPVDRTNLKAIDQDETLYRMFLKQSKAEGSNSDHLAFLDRGIDSSWLKREIAEYPHRLRTILPSSEAGSAYPKTGEMPTIESGLAFLHPDITQACVCVGGWQNGKLLGRWLGRRATAPEQMWSATKTFPMLRVAIRAQATSPPLPKLENCRIGSRPLNKIFDSIVSYDEGASASNAWARCLKQFDTPQGLENWLKACTGNTGSRFRGGYGVAPTVARPTLVDSSTGKTLLRASGADHTGENLVSAYDLCRMLGNQAWHPHLTAETRIPGLQQSGADTLTNSLGKDSARFVDVSLQALGLKDRLENVVVLSKLGFGFSDTRKQWESIYSAFVALTDKQTQKSHQFALALRGRHAPGSQAAVELDSRMAASVAQIIRRVVDGDLA